MSNFTRLPPGPPRFPGDFQLTVAGGYQATPGEQAYLDSVNSLVDEIALSTQDDAPQDYPDELASGRTRVRSDTIAALTSEVDLFLGGQNAAANVANLQAIRDTYHQTLPKFGARSASDPLYEGDFDIATVKGYAPGPDERMFLAAIKSATDEFKADKIADGKGGFSPGVIVARGRQREGASADMKARIVNYWMRSRGPKEATEAVLLARGQYQAKRDRLTKRLFNVKIDHAEVDGRNDTILGITLAGGLPSPQDAPSSDKQELFVQINKALTVVRTVCERMSDRSSRGAKSRFGRQDDQTGKHAEALQGEFTEKLGEIATIGLELDFTALGKRMLDEARNDFFVREAGRIKNMYVRRLGAWAALAAAAFLLAYASLHNGAWAWEWGSAHKNFLLAACGASIGTWASFSVRQVQFSFDDLVMVEESSLDPPMRILFVIVLTMTACLLFWTSAINIEVGELKTEPAMFKTTGSIALLIGLFCGLSERALATAIAGRAAAFVRSVG